MDRATSHATSATTRAVAGDGAGDGTRHRTRLAPDERRAQLVAIGVSALADRSLGELTMEHLAERAGVSRTLVSYYFGTKQGFHREVVLAARDGLLRSTEPDLTLAPLDRLHATLRHLVQFVHDHEPTFFSLVRGAASHDGEVREVVEEARVLQAERVLAVCAELGVDVTAELRLAVRSWVALAEQALVDGVPSREPSDARLVAYLERTLVAVVTTVDPRAARLIDRAGWIPACTCEPDQQP